MSRLAQAGESSTTSPGRAASAQQPTASAMSPTRVIGTPQVAFEMVTAQAPGVLRPVGQNGYVHLIMPMALR